MIVGNNRPGVFVLRGVVALLALASCSELEPCPGVIVGAKYEVTVGAHLDRTLNCTAAWGFAEGSSLTAEVVGEGGDEECKSGRVTLSDSGGWTFERRPANAPGGALWDSTYTIAREDCTGLFHMTAGCDEGCVVGGGSSCDCHMQVSGQAEEGSGCPGGPGGRCSEVVAVSITRL